MTIILGTQDHPKTGSSQETRADGASENRPRILVALIELQLFPHKLKAVC